MSHPPLLGVEYRIVGLQEPPRKTSTASGSSKPSERPLECADRRHPGAAQRSRFHRGEWVAMKTTRTMAGDRLHGCRRTGPQRQPGCRPVYGERTWRSSEARWRVYRPRQQHGWRSGESPASGFRYDGLYRVEESWREPGRSGFQLCCHRLVQLGRDGTPLPIPPDAIPPGPAPRAESSVQRIVRREPASKGSFTTTSARCAAS